MNLEQYLYEYIRDGGRNPSVLKKFIAYIEDNIVEVNDYPGVVDDFIDSLAYTGSTKRNYRTSCNNFVRYVYRRLGLFLPWEKPETETETCEVDYSPWSPTRKKLEKARIGIQEEMVNRNNTTTKKEIIGNEEYQAFLEKYERLCKLNG